MTRILEKAVAALNAGALKQAEQLYRSQLSQADTVQPERTQALYGLGRVVSRQGKFDEAKDTFRHLLHQARERTDPKAEHQALQRLSAVERLAGNPGAALELLEQGKVLLAQLPDDAHAAHHLEYGLTELSRLNLPAAATHFRTALTHATEAEDAVKLGHAYQGLGDVAAVRRDVHEANYYFEKAQARFEQAEAYRALAKLEQRVEALELEADETDLF